MSLDLPDYLSIPAGELGQGTPVGLRILADAESLARDFAEEIIHAVHQARADGHPPTLIVPVGPVDQFPLMAEQINHRRIDFRDVMLINMDEYLTPDDRWIDPRHPLAFRGFMDRNFYDLLDPHLVPPPQNRVFPDPRDPQAVARQIDARGGVDVCFGGIGINGHIAFNEPLEPGNTLSPEEFAALPTRTLALSRETRTINSVTVGGEISIVPTRAITLGMRELLASRECRFYCNRPWQSAVVRRVLHGPITAACPASLLRTHPHAQITLADFVARPPEIRLR